MADSDEIFEAVQVVCPRCSGIFDLDQSLVIRIFQGLGEGIKFTCQICEFETTMNIPEEDDE